MKKALLLFIPLLILPFLGTTTHEIVISHEANQAEQYIAFMESNDWRPQQASSDIDNTGKTQTPSDTNNARETQAPGNYSNAPSTAFQSGELGEFSAYNAEKAQTDNDPLIMASGKKVYLGAIACPARFSFGTKIRVNGSVYTCEDRMALRYRDKNNFDILLNDKNEAIAFGRKKLFFDVL